MALRKRFAVIDVQLPWDKDRRYGGGHRLCSWGWRSLVVARTHSQLLESTSNVFNPN